MIKNTKALDRRRKAALNSSTLELNKWCERVLEIVYTQYPRANVTFKQLLQLYITGIFYKTAAKHLCLKEHRKYGG